MYWFLCDNGLLDERVNVHLGDLNQMEKLIKLIVKCFNSILQVFPLFQVVVVLPKDFSCTAACF